MTNRLKSFFTRVLKLSGHCADSTDRHNISFVFVESDANEIKLRATNGHMAILETITNDLNFPIGKVGLSQTHAKAALSMLDLVIDLSAATILKLINPVDASCYPDFDGVIKTFKQPYEFALDGRYLFECMETLSKEKRVVIRIDVADEKKPVEIRPYAFDQNRMALVMPLVMRNIRE